MIYCSVSHSSRRVFRSALMKIHKTVDTPHDPLKVVDNPSNEAGDRKDLISTMTSAGLGPIRGGGAQRWYGLSYPGSTSGFGSTPSCVARSRCAACSLAAPCDTGAVCDP